MYMYISICVSVYVYIYIEYIATDKYLEHHLEKKI